MQDEIFADEKILTQDQGKKLLKILTIPKNAIFLRIFSWVLCNPNFIISPRSDCSESACQAVLIEINQAGFQLTAERFSLSFSLYLRHAYVLIKFQSRMWHTRATRSMRVTQLPHAEFRDHGGLYAEIARFRRPR